jgi:hypothetical protein
MRPYLAIIKDSFREAIASRVLWVLLLLIIVHLLLLAPLGIRLNLTTDFVWRDIGEGPELLTKLRKAASSDEPSPGKRIWSLFGDEAHKNLADWQSNEEGESPKFFQGIETLRTALNQLVHRSDLYEEAAWSKVSLSKECRDYLARDQKKLSKDELARLNRLLIEEPFPAHFRSRSSQSISLTYLGMDLSGPLPFSKEQADGFIREWVLSATMSFVVGIGGIVLFALAIGYAYACDRL